METKLKAQIFVTAAYGGAYGKGEYKEGRISFCMAAASIMEQVNEDFLIVPAMLQDIMEDTEIEYKHIRKFFGSRVAKMVEEIANLGGNGIDVAYVDKMKEASPDAQTVKLAGCIAAVTALISTAEREDLIRTTAYHTALQRMRKLIYSGLTKGNESLYTIGINMIDKELEKLGVV